MLHFFRRRSGGGESGPGPAPLTMPVSAEAVRAVFRDCGDFEARRVRTGGGEEAALVFLDGLVCSAAIAEQVLRPLTEQARFGGAGNGKQTIDRILSGAVYDYTVRRRDDMESLVTDLLNGWCALIFDGCAAAVAIEVKSPDKRSINLPTEEKVIKGGKDAFIEILRTNTALVRRRVRNRTLRFRETAVGSETGTRVAVVYLEGFTNPALTAETERRVKAIRTDGLLTAAGLEENLVDNPLSPFPQMLITERPDKFCLNLLEGRVGVLVDGLPMGFLTPGTFAQFMKVPEDLSSHFLVASALTLLRYLAMFVTLLLPGFFAAVAMYHQEMIPIKLLQSMVDAKQVVPHPIAVEIVVMLISFELLQEAGLRLPNPVGDTVSIIGALIVGQSAVEAKVVSPVVIVVIAAAGLAGYTMPSQDMSAALRLCRFLLVIAALLAGVFGLVVGVALLVYHLCTLESCGVAYMTPFAGGGRGGLLQALTRPLSAGRSAAERALKPGRR